MNTHPIFGHMISGMMEAQRLQAPGMEPPRPSGCPSCAAAEAQCDRMAQRLRELEAEVCDAAFAGHMIGADRAQERIRELESALDQAQAMLAHFDQENDRLATENRMLNASREDWKGAAERAQAALALEVKARVACAEIAHEAKLALAEAREAQCTR